ncbi:protein DETOXIFICATION 18 isoform X2 [Manihot esculenta]|nr:protein DETOXIFICATION 18 isoform X2 [Manihot esculenta]KAG8657963.1 hypothetical protein MANES_03G109100v8 [Manihot esculenta]
MSPKETNLEATPLLEPKDSGRCRRRWWKNVLDVEEAKKQMLVSLPMILTTFFYYSISLVSVMFAGRLGDLELAAATLAFSWANITGYNFTAGLSEALETFCGQGFGAKAYNMLGLYLQAFCIISFFFSITISILWLYTEKILIILNQDPQISKEAALYIKYLIPGLFAYGFLQNIMRFLQTQSVVVPLVLCSAIPMFIHIGITYGLVHCANFGFKGAPLAASISLWISFFVLAMYVLFAKKIEHTWCGFSFESFHYLHITLKLALPSAAMVCLDDWATEILVFLAGLMPDSQISTSLLSMCVNAETVAFMLADGLSAAASTRISNELGAGNPDRAKNAVAVTLKLSLILALILVLSLVLGHKTWTNLFSESRVITKEFESMLPLLAISITLDSVSGVLSG